MSVRQGDRVLVNIAPFIGSTIRSEQSVPCRVLGVRVDEVQVCPEPPCREVTLWVGALDRKPATPKANLVHA